MSSDLPKMTMGDLLTSHDPDRCYKYEYNFTYEAIRLLEAGQKDSVLEIAEFIRQDCGDNSRLVRTRLLLALDGGWFADSLYDSTVIGHMRFYRNGRQSFEEYIERMLLFGYGGSDVEADRKFNHLTDSLATNALTTADPSSEAAVFALLYSNESDSAFALLQSPPLAKSRLRGYYDRHIGKLEKLWSTRGHFAIGLGTWYPQGNNRILGRHTAIDFLIGGENLEQRWRADLIISCRLGDPDTPYIVRTKHGVIDTTTEYDSGLMGVDAGYLLPDLWLLKTDIFSGLGWDILTSVKEEEGDDRVKGHGCANLSIGLRTRFFLDHRHGWYIGATYRYSLTGYRNDGGTNIGGNSAQLSFVFGRSFNASLNQALRGLNYKG